MPSDEEFRKVAEDVRALARSLARDFWEASSSARGSGRPTSEAFRHGLRGAARGFRRGMRPDRRGWANPPRGWVNPPQGWVNPPRGWGNPPRGWTAPPPGPTPPGAWSPAPGNQPPGPQGRPWPQAGPPWAQAGGWPPAYPYRRPPHRARKGPLPPVRRRWDASVLAAILILVFGVAWLIGGLGLASHVSVEAVLALGLMLLGASLIVTARTDWSLSRHAWPVVLGGVLVVGLFATSTSFGVAGALSHLSFGDMSRHPTTPGTVYGGFGQLTVDASGIDHGNLDVQSVAGQTVVNLGQNQSVSVDAHVLAGQICVDGRTYSNGVGSSAGPIQVGQGTPAVTIHIHQVAGQVVVGAGGCGR